MAGRAHKRIRRSRPSPAIAGRRIPFTVSTTPVARLRIDETVRPTNHPRPLRGDVATDLLCPAATPDSIRYRCCCVYVDGLILLLALVDVAGAGAVFVPYVNDSESRCQALTDNMKLVRVYGRLGGELLLVISPAHRPSPRRCSSTSRKPLTGQPPAVNSQKTLTPASCTGPRRPPSPAAWLSVSIWLITSTYRHVTIVVALYSAVSGVANRDAT